MTIRDYRRRRWPGWLALVAALLLALAPPLSRLLAARAAPVHDHAATAHAHHEGDGGGSLAQPRISGDDCLGACGYCDFLAHAPLVPNAVPDRRACVPVAMPAPAPRIDVPAHAPPLRAARPRGPPRLA